MCKRTPTPLNDTPLGNHQRGFARPKTQAPGMSSESCTIRFTSLFCAHKCASRQIQQSHEAQMSEGLHAQLYSYKCTGYVTEGRGCTGCT